MNYPQKRNITFCFLKNPSAFKKVDNYPFFILPYERPVLGTPLVQIKKKNNNPTILQCSQIS